MFYVNYFWEFILMKYAKFKKMVGWKCQNKSGIQQFSKWFLIFVSLEFPANSQRTFTQPNNPAL